MTADNEAFSTIDVDREIETLESLLPIAGLVESMSTDPISAVAFNGLMSAQIGKDIDLSEQTVRQYANEAGITIHAEKVLGRGPRLEVNNSGLAVGAALVGVRLDTEAPASVEQRSAVGAHDRAGR